MESRRALFLLCLILMYGSTCFARDQSVSSCSDESDDNEEVVSTLSATDSNESAYDEDEGEIFEENPFYEPPAENYETLIDALNHTDWRNNNDNSTLQSKGVIDKSLSQHSRGLRRRSLTLLRKFSLKITIALAIYAFRNELRTLLWHLISRPEQDPETGQVVRRPVPPSFTAILKLIIFIDLMRRLQSTNGDSNKSSNLSPLVAVLLAGGRGNPFLSMFLSKLLEPSNSAYIPPVQQHYTFERINNRYSKDADALRKVIAPNRVTSASSSSPHRNSSPLTLSKLFPNPHSLSPNQQGYSNETVILLDWTGLDTSVSQMTYLRDEVSFLISQYRNESCSDPLGSTPLSRSSSSSHNNNGTIVSAPLQQVDVEVVVVLESPGGSASDYALAAQQILRMRQSGMRVTICVDKVAASGGYMIACTASPGRLFAAPFALVGSIGVIGQALNIHKTLKGWGVEPLVFRGGRDKAPVGMIGEVTEEGMRKVQHMVDNTHRAFKKHVADARPVLADRIEELATGDVWLGYDAMDIGLVDRLVTSDEYVEERLAGGARVLKLMRLGKPKYPFGRPTTSTLGERMSVAPSEGTSWLRVLTDFHVLLQRATDLLRDLVVAGDVPNLSLWMSQSAATTCGASGPTMFRECSKS